MITLGCLSKKTPIITCSGICNNCNNQQQKLFSYNSVNLCELCSTVAVFSTSPHVMKKGVLMYSQLKQNEIIDMTYNFFLKNKRMPRINEIDQNAQRPRISVPNILMNINGTENIKLFFTDMINSSAIITYSVFSEIPSKNNDLMFFYDIEKNID